MWYEDTDKASIDYSKPIVARRGCSKYLLVPLKGEGYSVEGYEWFNITTGEYNSNMCWRTAQEAVDCYKQSHDVFNVNLTWEK